MRKRILIVSRPTKEKIWQPIFRSNRKEYIIEIRYEFKKDSLNIKGSIMKEAGTEEWFGRSRLKAVRQYFSAAYLKAFPPEPVTYENRKFEFSREVEYEF